MHRCSEKIRYVTARKIQRDITTRCETTSRKVTANDKQSWIRNDPDQIIRRILSVCCLLSQANKHIGLNKLLGGGNKQLGVNPLMGKLKPQSNGSCR